MASQMQTVDMLDISFGPTIRQRFSALVYRQLLEETLKTDGTAKR